LPQIPYRRIQWNPLLKAALVRLFAGPFGACFSKKLSDDRVTLPAAKEIVALAKRHRSELEGTMNRKACFLKPLPLKTWFHSLYAHGKARDGLLENFSERLINNEGLREIGSFDSVSISESLVLLPPARWVERNRHASQLVHHGVESVLHRLFHPCECGLVYEVILLHWVFAKIE